jgi:hypothetical protein
MNDLTEKIKEYLSFYLPDDMIPPEYVLLEFIEDAGTKNPFRIIYMLILAASSKTALAASKFSDDGVSYQYGTGVASLVEFLPLFKKQADSWDLDNGQTWAGFAYPHDPFSDVLDEWGV